MVALTIVQRVQEAGRWVFSEDIRNAYWHQWKAHECRNATGLMILMSFQGTLSDSVRSLLLDDVPIIDGDYHDDDQFLVGAAAAAPAGALLVTTDERLRKALKRAGLDQAHGFQVLEPLDALGLLDGGGEL